MIASTSAGSLTVAEYRALAEFRHAVREFLHFSERAARAAGLEPQHHQLLLALKGLPPGVVATVGTLAARLRLAPHTTVGLIDRMEARGLLQRTRGTVDRRCVLLRLTRRGDAILRTLSLAHRAELRAFGPALLRALVPLVSRRRGGRRAAAA